MRLAEEADKGLDEYHLGMALWELDQRERARELLAVALALADWAFQDPKWIAIAKGEDP